MSDQGIPVIGPLLNKIIGTRNERFVKRYLARVTAINALEPRVRQMTDAQIRGMLGEFRDRLKQGASRDELLVEVFAIAREAMDRSVGIRNAFDPKQSFDASRLPEPARAAYQATRAAMDALPPAPPEGEYSGGNEPIPGWRQLDIPNEVYDAVRELYPESRPPFRARPFDVQLIGGMVLYQGKIAEMRTGEGKTIVAPLACYLRCIERRKVHVVTVNDYLVQRDRDWTAPFFRALGLTVGAIHPMHMQGEDVKRRMYRCDVVYGTTSEFGFDYLRDNMKRSVEAQVQRRREFAIVDEVDSILIDEARTPLIISGPAHDDQPRYDLADRLARHLVEKQKEWQERDDRVQHCQQRIKGLEGDIRQARDRSQVPDMQKRLAEARAELPGLERDRDKHVQYYETHPERKQAHLTHDGVAEAQRAAGIGSFYVGENMDLPHLLEQSIRAHVVYMLDRDYVVMNQPDPMTGRTDPSIVIVDTFTGRPMIGRQWSDGLHQAVECKEKVPIKQETQTVATVTIQNFFKMYKRLAGMTGTADTEAQEFHDIYKLDVVSIPTNKPVIRDDFDDLMFLRAKDKWGAIVDEVKTFHDVGRPVLVGTTSVEKSEMLSKMLTGRHAVRHEVLNAKQHEREAHIIENAGQLGAVMIATNMAGRGTDIKLGRVSRETLLDHWLRRGLAPRTVTVDSTEEQLREGVFRKIAPKELGENKRDVETMPPAELELGLLRLWAEKHTWCSPKQIARMSAAELRDALDESGRFLLHRLRWFESIEEMGGLHVIGTERHEARRIDNQLRGRCGRQGDNGSSRFYVSLEDDLMKMFAGETQMKILSRLGMKEGDSIEHPLLTRSVERAQRKVEERNFEVRKNILEYDEVMEHQRQRFYGLRQQVLEGRDVKGLILGYIRDAVRDAAAEYLAPDYPHRCVAEFARQKLETDISPERLRGLEGHEMEKRLRDEAIAEVRSMVDITLGEYLPSEGSEAAVDMDAAGLAQWARTRFGVDLDVQSLGERVDRPRVRDMLVDAAVARIEATDLSGLYPFLAPTYGAAQLASWYKGKFSIGVTPEEIVAAQADPQNSAASILVKRAEDLYAKREVEYPVDFAIEMTMMMMRQNPQAALGQLVAWANRRYGLDWAEEKVRAMPPAKVREELVAASRQFVESGVLDKEIGAALATKNDDELEAHLKARFGAGLPDWMRHFDEDDRPDAVRSRVESILRSELLHFEQTILLETLDGMWKDHLHSMDQLRDAIGFRAYSQLDPKIEFKREGANLFVTSLDTVRDKITDYIFKVRLTPPGMPQGLAPRPAMPMPMPPPRQVPGAGAGGGTSGGMYTAPAGVATGISGPGLDTPMPPPPSAERQRDLDAANRAGAGPATPESRAAGAKEQVDAARAARAADRGKERKR
ncbi:MAG: preprotein translocase subunit SecA [Phycisphaerales bacterium]|nr:preprotein translocase subunit SecA [Phycisphaerales bacterium]